MGSTVHGLRASKVVLPNESAEELQKLADDWTDHYRPQSPGRRALVDRAFMATVHHQRSKRYLAATLGEQVRNAERRFDEDQENLVRHYTELLPSDPAAAVQGLRRTAAGCRWLLRAWLGLETDQIQGTWTPSRRELAARLLGHRPEDPTDEVSYTLIYLTLTACEGLTPEVVSALLDPRRMPDTLFRLRERPLPPPEESRKKLGDIVAKQIVEYEALARRLRIEVEEPARAAAVENAMVLKGEALALWLRYERMHDSMFHRSYNALEEPEAPPPEAAPEAEPQAGPTAPMEGDGPVPEDNAGAAAPAADPLLMEGEGPLVTEESVVERQSKRVATAEPVDPVAPAASAENDAGGEATAAPAGGVDSHDDETPAPGVVSSWAVTILGAAATPSGDAAEGPDPAAAGECCGAPAGSRAETLDTAAKMWREYFTPERIAAIQAAYQRHVEEQMKRRPRDG
jgi:hypothetical protein